MRVLVVEPQPYHGQVLLPLLDTLQACGACVDLFLRPDHFDRETVIRRGHPNVSLRPLTFRNTRELGHWAARVDLRGTDAVLVTTVKPYHWFVPLLLGLRHRRTSAILHNVDRLPSPAARGLSWRANLLCWLVSALMRRLVVLSPEVADTLSSEAPGWFSPRVGVYRPLPGRDSPVVPPPDRAVFAVPGAINPKRRDYHKLLKVLEGRRLDSRIRFRLIGSERQSEPELLMAFSQYPEWVELEIQDWWDYDDLLEQVASAHYVLPLMSGKRYLQTSVPAAIGWADGLARPLLRPEEDNLEEPLQEAGLGVFDGRWSELCQAAHQERDRLWHQGLACIKSLV